MNSAPELLASIQQSLADFSSLPFETAALSFWKTLGYASELRYDDLPSDAAGFADAFGIGSTLRDEKARVELWQNIHFLFQLTDEEIQSQNNLFGQNVDKQRHDSYLFFALELKAGQHARGVLAQIARELNRPFGSPILLLIKNGDLLSLAVVDRRDNKKDASREVLEKVTLIHDINFTSPHAAHLRILAELQLANLQAANWQQLHEAWKRVLDLSALNKKFFKELSDWYFWARDNELAKFPGATDENQRAVWVIRLLTRAMFVYFIKERGLVPDAFFQPQTFPALLKDVAPESGSYYNGVLQNLFFASLNAETKDRGWFEAGKSRHGKDDKYLIHTKRRGAELFQKPDAAQELFDRVPFLNGGLFECLDTRDDDNKTETRCDGFSSQPKKRAHLPNFLFWGAEYSVDLSGAYNDAKKKAVKVQPLLTILNKYKFTVAENTPLEEEVALDPELLGKVFENLLASYNPETRDTARKQTGSFYTPREIVDYMVEESLIAYLETATNPNVGARHASPKTSQSPETPANPNPANPESQDDETPQDDESRDVRARHASPLQLGSDNIRELVALRADGGAFSKAEKERLIAAISNAHILDPACGSGAFPMGILQRMVSILKALDPGNELWKAEQLKKIEALDIAEIKERERERLEEIWRRDAGDYARKLYLIEHCLFGVDIQPIAVQITKLRFFISLVVEQKLETQSSSFSVQNSSLSVQPLPNLETKIVAANTLLAPGGAQGVLSSPDAKRLEDELFETRRNHFGAKSYARKKQLREDDKRLREALAAELESVGMPHDVAQQMAAWNPYDQNSFAPFFDPEWMFGPELKNGFDIVIGNPPYVRHERIAPLKPLLAPIYPEAFVGTADLYVYFFAQAVQALKPGGVLCFITSNKYFRAGYGAKLRHHLATKTTVRALADFGDEDVFTAIAYPSIICLSRSTPAADHAVRALNWQRGEDVQTFAAIFARDAFDLPQAELTGEGWRLEAASTLRLLEKLRQNGTPLGEYVGGKFYYGIKTGLNEAFVVDRATRDRLIQEDASSAELLKPFLRGRDVKRWQAQPQDLWLILARRGLNIESYPAVKKHLLKFKPALENRAGVHDWFQLQASPAEVERFETSKIIYPDIYLHQSFCWDEENLYATNTCYFIPTKEKWLCALLNSETVEWFYRNISNSIRGGYLRAFSDSMKQIPIPAATPAQQQAIAELVDQILAAKQKDASADVSTLEAEINALVYALYGLSADEKKLIGLS